MLNIKETTEYYQGQSNRVLFKALRDTASHLNDLVECYNKNWKQYLGSPINSQIMDTRTEYHIILKLAEGLGFSLKKIGRVPDLIHQKTAVELSTERYHAKKEAELQAVEKEKAEAAAIVQADNKAANYFMTKFAAFALGYNSNFISVAFESNGMVRHLQSKFDYAYSKHGAMGAVLGFWCELDLENRRLLTDYINQNF